MSKIFCCFEKMQELKNYGLSKLLGIDYPIIMAPMFLVSDEKMLIAASKVGISGCVPALNYRTTTELEKAITDALKDYPGVKSELKDGVLKLTGEVAKSSVQKLMIAVNGLRSLGLKKIESTGLIKK